MRVISQDNTFSVNFESTVFWTQNNIVYAMIGGGSKVFGKYESKERAEEVFQEIHEVYLSKADGEKHVYYMPEK